MSKTIGAKKIPKWFNQKPNDETKLKIKKALINYVVSLGPDAPKPEPSKNTSILVLPEMIKLDKLWAKVTSTNLHPYKYEAHRIYDSTIRNYLQSISFPDDLKIAQGLIEMTDSEE
jgi:hypothetical protein